MTENGRTLTFVGVALALGVVALVTRPKQEPPAVADIVGKPLFKEFDDPNEAASLRIVNYAEDLGEVTSFEVAKNSRGLWTIPSHGNYPADAETQMKDAATSLVGLNVLDIASEDPQDHAMYGVREPNEKLQLGDKGVGLLVSFDDAGGNDLGSLIIGQKVKGSDTQRFVRVPGQDQVFVVNFAPEKLSLKFADWIEKDLLQINAFDVESLRIKDHSVITTTQGPVAQPRSDVAVSLGPNGTDWQLDEMVLYREGKTVKSELLPNEELNKEKLDALKNSLTEVKIADVFQKPKGLDASLKTTGDFLKDREAQRSLAQRGFYLAENNEVWSANGELQVGLKNGVEYVLRFGNVSGEQDGAEDGALNRYMFVMARVDESKFPKPQLEDVPGEGSADAAAAPDATPATPAAPATPSAPPQDPAAPAPASDASPTKSDEPAADATDNSDEQSDEPSDADEQADADEDPPAAAPDAASQSDAKSDAPADNAKAADAPADNAKAADAPADNAKAADAPAAPNADAPPVQPAADSPAAGDDEIKRKKLEAERDRILKENQRKLEKWNEDKSAAEAKVRELNGRFAPWYYVISEDVYKKIHLSRSDITRESAKAADEGTGIDAFRKLESEGVRKPPAGPGPGAMPGGFPGGFPPGAFPPGGGDQ